MKLTTTAFRIVPLETRWASVTVMDKDGRIEREFRVTAEEHDAARVGEPAWHEDGKNWLMVGRVLHPGLAVSEPNGSLVVCYGDIGAHPKTMRLEAHEWAEADGVVSVRSDKSEMLTKEWYAC